MVTPLLRPLSCIALFAIACAANPSSTTPARSDTTTVAYPRLPDSVISMRGWTRVHRVNRPLDCGGIDAIGCFEYETRRLTVVRELGPKEAWGVLYHEEFHMVLNDANLLHVGTALQQDSVADALAAVRVLERIVPTRRP